MNAPNTTSTALVSLPSDAMQLMSLAKDLANARLIPSHFQKSPADVWMVMNFCRTRGLDFFMTVGECNVVQGRLFFSGKLSAALLNSSGYLADRLSYDYGGEGEERYVDVSARLVNEPTPRTVRVVFKDVKTNNQQWVKNVDQMLSYSGSRQWGRRHLPEVLLGMLFEGETVIDHDPHERPARGPFTPTLPTQGLRDKVDDAVKVATVTPPPGDTVAPPDKVTHFTPLDGQEPPQGQEPPADEGGLAPQEGAVIARQGDDKPAWIKWSSTMAAHIRAAPDADAINELLLANADDLAAMHGFDEALYARFVAFTKEETEKRTVDGT